MANRTKKLGLVARARRAATRAGAAAVAKGAGMIAERARKVSGAAGERPPRKETRTIATPPAETRTMATPRRPATPAVSVGAVHSSGYKGAARKAPGGPPRGGKR